MGQADYFAPGDWNASCFQCGFKFKASQLRRTWQGFYACQRCWEPRQSQDFVRAVVEKPEAPWVQPINYAFAYSCGPNDRSAIAGDAVAGCAESGYISPSYILPIS